MTTYKKYLIAAAICLLVMQITGHSQPRNIQARVIEITGRSRGKIECKAISMQGDTIHICYGFHGWSKHPKFIQVGTWLTIRSDYSHKYCEWIATKIKINN